MVHGLKFAIDKGIKHLVVVGDFELLVKQVKRKYACYNYRLLNYRSKVWDLIAKFE